MLLTDSTYQFTTTINDEQVNLEILDPGPQVGYRQKYLLTCSRTHCSRPEPSSVQPYLLRPRPHDIKQEVPRLQALRRGWVWCALCNGTDSAWFAWCCGADANLACFGLSRIAEAGDKAGDRGKKTWGGGGNYHSGQTWGVGEFSAQKFT